MWVTAPQKEMSQTFEYRLQIDLYASRESKLYSLFLCTFIAITILQ